MAQRLNQLLAVEKQIKDSAGQALTTAYHDAQRSQLVDGLTRTYKPVEEDGEIFPKEEKVLQVRIAEVLKDTSKKLTELLDLTIRKDLANCQAKANIEVDGKILVPDAPATYLLWLEKKLIDVRTFVSKLPRLSSDERWTFDETQNCYVAAPSQTVKTKKLNVHTVVVPATEHHPAQVSVNTEDRTIGHWTSVKYSGALPAVQVSRYLERIDILIAAVKQARTKANSVEVPTVDPVGQKVLGFIFG
jgi:hypothetical protein